MTSGRGRFGGGGSCAEEGVRRLSDGIEEVSVTCRGVSTDCSVSEEAR